MSLPNKFEIHAKYNPASRHIATLNEAGTKYLIQSRESLDNAYDAPVELSVRFVQEALDEGSWIMTKIVEEDRLLVFPFTAVCSDYPFVVTEGATAGYVTCTYPHDGETYVDAYPIATAKGYVKSGVWRVKSVGEKPEEKAPHAPESISNSVATLTIDVDTNAAVLAVERLASAYEALNIAMESCLALNEKLKGLV